MEPFCSHHAKFAGRLLLTIFFPCLRRSMFARFEGEARAETCGRAINHPSLAGDSGIGELGLTFTPSYLCEEVYIPKMNL
jgi:hypothetical protein